MASAGEIKVDLDLSGFANAAAAIGVALEAVKGVSEFIAGLDEDMAAEIEADPYDPTPENLAASAGVREALLNDIRSSLAAIVWSDRVIAKAQARA